MNTLTTLAATAAALVVAPTLVVATAAPSVGTAAGPPPGSAATASAARPAAAATGRLTNLDHLDFLGDTVTPEPQPGHTTYRLAQEPRLGTLWTYADRDDDGSYRRIGGGTLDTATDTWSQGAFNADDVARAAVVYVRHWRQTGAATSREAAYQMLRGLTFMQTTTGPDRGNVVLWQQPDGTLNPSAEPVELPDPSDSEESYWLARTVWALGEAYPAFRRTDPAFARFLRQRLDLAVSALDRQVLDAYGRYLRVDGARVPAWLVVDGADASAEAVLGLAAYVRSGGTPQARRVLRQLSEGIAEMSGGTARTWPYGGVQPWALSRANWHAWASQMPAALSQASRALGDRSLARTAARDAFTFDPWLLTSGGPDNGRQPTRTDANQIAYGVDARLQSLLAVGRPASDRLAGLVAAWYFGANASGRPTYDPATGVTFDGVSPDGEPNRNSGAESTIHGLLSMLALDAHPRVARDARTATLRASVGPTTVQAEDATLKGPATAVAPDSTWTGESAYGGTGYASLRDGSTIVLDVGEHGDALLVPVVDRRPGSTGVTTFRAGGSRLGAVRAGQVGAQGDSPAPGALLPSTLPRELEAGLRTVTATTTGSETRLDAVVVQPLLTRLVRGGDGHGTALLRSASTRTERARVTVPGSGRAVVQSYDGRGRLVARRTTAARTVPVRVVPGGFVLVRR